MRRGTLGLVLALILSACGWQSGGGQDAADYPGQEITLVVGTSAGGGHDAYARAFAEAFKQEIGVSVVVTNVSGAGGRLAAQEVAGAEPDGYTIHLLAPDGMAAYQAIVEPDPDLTKFTPLGIVSRRPAAFAVAANSEIQSWDQLVAAGKAATLQYATAGLTSPNTLNGVIAAAETGIRIETVPHEGSSEAFTSVIRGDSDFTVISADSVAESVRKGDLRALVQFGAEPFESLPGVPTGKDVGLPELDEKLSSALVLVAPPGLPDGVRETLTAAVQKALEGEELAAWADSNDRIVSPGTPEEMTELLNGSMQTYAEYSDTLAQLLEG